ncbi:putative importin subunit alpha [Phytophthora cinnamomi]|uniref:putative importin subunit alpha n=1 Tax=Phytophthora cinnamomi TaxID=4785 RepID=UPI00355A51FF|nr:putative importin subunit alpha [Phytophthora cinnamomi]
MSTPKARKSVKVGGNVGVLTGRRNRQETMLSIRKAKKEDAYATRRNLKANHPPAAAQTASRKELLLNLASRSQALLLGIQRPDALTRQKSMRAFVYLLSSGVPPLFDESDSQHEGLWRTILAALPSFVAILNEALPDANAVQLHSDAAFALRFISSMDKASAVIGSGAVPKLVQLFQSGISELQIQAAWCLGNIASASAESCEEIVKVCPPSLVLPHIRMATPSLRRAAVWLLRSLVEFPDVLDKSGVMGPDTKREMMEVLASIILQLSNEKVSNFVSANGQAGEAIKFKKAAAIAPWRIFEINTGKPAPNDIAVVRFVREVDETTVEVMDVDVNFETGENMVFQAKKADMRPLQVVDDAIGEDDELEDEETDLLDEQVLTLCDSCWALVEMTLHDSDVVGGIVSAGLCPRLVELLYISQSSVILAPVLRLLGNIVSAEISFSQAVIDAKLLEVIPSVMTTTSRAVREEACWMLSNIAGGQEEQVVAMMNAPGVINGLVEQMAWAEYGVKREATWAMCNIIVRANLDFIKEAVRMGVLQSFCPLLDEWEDPMVELVILEAIESLLQKDPQEGRIAVEESGCLEKIEELCYDQNEDVSGMASQLIDTWFDNAGDEADATLAPAVVGSEQTGEALNFQPVQGDVQFNFNQS